LTFDQSFDWLLTRGPSRDAANASITGALADSAQLEADLAAEVRRAFYALVAARQLHALVVAQAATADTLAGMAEHRFKSGDISRFEADAALLEAQRVRLNLSRAREVETIAGAEFGRTLGLMEVSRAPVPIAGLDDGLDELGLVRLRPRRSSRAFNGRQRNPPPPRSGFGRPNGPGYRCRALSPGRNGLIPAAREKLWV
jgi:Outer membrane protein